MLWIFTKHQGHTWNSSQHGMVSRPPQQLITATAHHLVFHAGENDVQHLSKSSLGSGLIDEIFAGQIDIVTCPDRLQDSTLVNFNVRGRHRSQQSLKQKSAIFTFTSTHLPSSHSQTFLQGLALFSIWFGLRRWLCKLNWMISTKSQPSTALSLNTIINSIEYKLFKVHKLCWSGLSTSLLFKKPRIQTLLSGGKVLQLDLTYANHKIYMFWCGGEGQFPSSLVGFQGSFRKGVANRELPHKANTSRI